MLEALCEGVNAAATVISGKEWHRFIEEPPGCKGSLGGGGHCSYLSVPGATNASFSPGEAEGVIQGRTGVPVRKSGRIRSFQSVGEAGML